MFSMRNFRFSLFFVFILTTTSKLVLLFTSGEEVVWGLPPNRQQISDNASSTTAPQSSGGSLPPSDSSSSSMAPTGNAAPEGQIPLAQDDEDSSGNSGASAVSSSSATDTPKSTAPSSPPLPSSSSSFSTSVSDTTTTTTSGAPNTIASNTGTIVAGQHLTPSGGGPAIFPAFGADQTALQEQQQKLANAANSLPLPQNPPPSGLQTATLYPQLNDVKNVSGSMLTQQSQTNMSGNAPWIPPAGPVPWPRPPNGIGPPTSGGDFVGAGYGKPPSVLSTLWGRIKNDTRKFMDGLKHVMKSATGKERTPVVNPVVRAVPLFLYRLNDDSIRLYNMIMSESNSTEAEILEHLEQWATVRGVRDQLDYFVQLEDQKRVELFQFLGNNTMGDAAEFLQRLWIIATDDTISLPEECEALRSARENISEDAQTLLPVVQLVGPIACGEEEQQQNATNSVLSNVFPPLLQSQLQQMNSNGFELPFSNNVSRNAFLQFQNLTTLRHIPKSELHEEFRKWAENNNLSTEFALYHSAEEQLRQNAYNNLTANLAGEALDLVKSIWVIASNESLVPGNDCAQIHPVYNAASIQLRQFINQAVLNRLGLHHCNLEHPLFAPNSGVYASNAQLDPRKGFGSRSHEEQPLWQQHRHRNNNNGEM